MNDLKDILPIGLQPDLLIVGMAGAAAFLAVIAVWMAIVQRDPLSSRLKMLAERRAALKAGLMAGQSKRGRAAPAA